MNERGIKIGQYAYTKDGIIIRIDEIDECKRKYRGSVINLSVENEVELDDSDIYGIAGGIH